MNYEDLIAAMQGQGGAATGAPQMIGKPMFQGQPMEQNVPAPSVLNAGMDGLSAYLRSGGHKAAAPQGWGQLGSTSQDGLAGLLRGQGAQAGATLQGAAPSAAGGLAGGAGLAGLGFKALNDTGISSYGDSLKGKAWSNLVDSTGMGDNAIGNNMKALGDFQSGNFGGAVKNGVKGIKDLFSLKWF